MNQSQNTPKRGKKDLIPPNLLELEEPVFTAIQEYLGKNRTFQMNEIVPFINSKLSKKALNINQEGIRKVLESLAEKHMIAEGTKLTKDDILILSKRKKIYDYIKENPAVILNKIANELEISNYHVFWHMKMLVKFHYIREEEIDNHKIYFDSKRDFNDVKRIYYTSNEKCQKLLFYLDLNKEGLTKTQLSDALKMHPNTATKYLEILGELKLISNEKIDNKTLYFLKGL